MPGTKIQAAERPIGDIFSDEYRFSIPRYQRPYAWTTKQAGELFDDVLTAASTKPALDDADPYFLGSIVLEDGERRPGGGGGRPAAPHHAHYPPERAPRAGVGRVR